MNDIERADRKLLVLSILNPMRLAALIGVGYVSYLLWGLHGGAGFIGLVLMGASVGVFGITVRNDFLDRRFMNAEHKHLWSLIEDRMARIREAMRKLPAHIHQSLSDLEHGIDRTASRLYFSLRRADIVKREIAKSEGPIGASGMPFHVGSHDEETKDLYVQADKNVAEYRKHFQGIAARVTRTEGQCAVFISALDSLRVRLLGYRLVGDKEQVPATDFGHEMETVKSQLESIDRALFELDLPITPAVEAEQVQTLGNISDTPP